MSNFERVYPNGTIAYFRTGWGRLVRLENVPRLEYPAECWGTGKWEYSNEGGEVLTGYEFRRHWYDETEGVTFFESVEIEPVNRHNFNVYENAAGEPQYRGKHTLWYCELMGGWYLS